LKTISVHHLFVPCGDPEALLQWPGSHNNLDGRGCWGGRA
jgi:hypothetical protein